MGYSVFAQQKKIATPKQYQNTTADAKLKQILKSGNEDMVSNKKIVPMQNYEPKPHASAALSIIPLGRASNSFTWLRQEQNQIWANNDLDMVAVIHRQDVTIWGGGTTENGKYRYDFSINNAASFTTDIGTLQSTYTNYGRYPQITGHVNGKTNPFDIGLVWNGATNKFPTPGWIGHVYGYSEVTTTSPPTSTENYMFDTDNTLLPGGLSEGLPGEFWTVEMDWDGSNVLDSVLVYKGTWDSASADVNWVRHTGIYVPWDKTADGTAHAVGPNIAFSPDGMTAWIGMCGDMTGGGANQFYSPILIKSTDGGATWGSPTEVMLDSIPWMVDTLQTLWVDSVGNPASDGRATTAFDFDLVVDVNGNPHLGCVIGTGGAGQAYSIAGTAKFIGDVWSADGGATWDVTYMAPVMTLRGEFGTPDPNDGSLLSMDNCVQASRSESGEHVFFSWVDSDTCVIGFGETDNIAPNLRIVGKRVSDTMCTHWKVVSDGDILYDGTILYPAMAPTILEHSNAMWLPIAFMKLLINDQLGPTEFEYVTNAGLTAADFSVTPGVTNQAWMCAGDPGYSDHEIQVTPNSVVGPIPPAPTGTVLHQAYPNPTNGMTTVAFEIEQSQDVQLIMTNMIGQQVMTIANGEFNTGTHKFQINTSDLKSGVYFYTLKAGNEQMTKKLVVSK